MPKNKLQLLTDTEIEKIGVVAEAIEYGYDRTAAITDIKVMILQSRITELLHIKNNYVAVGTTAHKAIARRLDDLRQELAESKGETE